MRADAAAAIYACRHAARCRYAFFYVCRARVAADEALLIRADAMPQDVCQPAFEFHMPHALCVYFKMFCHVYSEPICAMREPCRGLFSRCHAYYDTPPCRCAAFACFAEIAMIARFRHMMPFDAAAAALPAAPCTLFITPLMPPRYALSRRCSPAAA